MRATVAPALPKSSGNASAQQTIVFDIDNLITFADSIFQPRRSITVIVPRTFLINFFSPVFEQPR
jgi:hypothetical protein